MKTSVSLERVRGCLLGVAVGDALGLPMEGLSPATITRRFGALDRFHLLGRVGVVSDDTEQTALIAQALSESVDDDRVVARFRRHLRWWFARLPFGIGLATLRSSLKLWLGFERSGVSSGGNGAAMRATIVGVVIGDAKHRRSLGRRLAEVTHTHPLAVEAALYVAEVASLAARTESSSNRFELVRSAASVLTEQALKDAISSALELPADPLEAGERLGTTGFSLHSVGLCTWAFIHGATLHDALRLVIRAGGDTDTHGAIVGGWSGALFGDAAIPASLVSALARGPFGARHLDGLAHALSSGAPAPSWSATVALLRNLALYPVVLAHGLRRLIPFG